MIKNILETVYPLTEFNIILADGKFPTQKYLQHLLTKAETIIACDGATDILVNHGIIPNHIIGDCDSITYKNHQQFNQLITKVTDQDTNDLTKAINLAKRLELDNIVILGATGMREDHAIANIALLTYYSTMFRHIAIISDYGIFTVNIGNNSIKAIRGQQVSFFSMHPDTLVNCSGLKWNLVNFKFELWHNGTLNEATGDIIEINSTAPVLVYRSFCIKNV